MATRATHADTIIFACGGIPNATIRAALVGWSMQETGGTPRPQNNMLACGQKEPGSFTYPQNGIVQGYPTIGLEGTAIADNLSDGNPGYAALKAAIAGGYWDSSVQQGLITWVGHDAYGSKWASFVATGNQHLQDDYDSGSSGNGVPPQKQNDQSSSDPVQQLADLLVKVTAPLLNAGNILQALSNIAQDPIRLVKFLVGLTAMGLGLLMVVVDVTEIISKSQPVQAVKKASGTIKKGAVLLA